MLSIIIHIFLQNIWRMIFFVVSGVGSEESQWTPCIRKKMIFCCFLNKLTNRTLPLLLILFFSYCRTAAFSICLANISSVLHRCHIGDVFAIHQDKCQVLGLKNKPNEKEEADTRYTIFVRAKCFTLAFWWGRTLSTWARGPVWTFLNAHGHRLMCTLLRHVTIWWRFEGQLSILDADSSDDPQSSPSSRFVCSCAMRLQWWRLPQHVYTWWFSLTMIIWSPGQLCGNEELHHR